MPRVFIVFIEHAENGLSSSSALLAILERVNPEVIFLELPGSALDDYLSGTRSNLESVAVNRYREHHQVEVIPVDLPSAETAIPANLPVLFDKVASTGPDYDHLARFHRRHTNAHGLMYLNSEACDAYFSKQREVILAGIAQLADPGLAEAYELWMKLHDRREIAMMENVEKHCRHLSFSTYVFLVGAAHRKSIIRLSRKEPRHGASTIQWAFLGATEELTG